MNKKVVVVTGARRGIGLGIAKEMGLTGCYVVMSSRSANAQNALDEMKALDLQDSCEYIQCDISNTDSRSNLIETVCKKFGRIDILINCAGVAPKTRLDVLETTEDSYDYVVNTNARSTFFMCQLVANQMISLKKEGKIEDYSPCIINISSISAYTVSSNRAEYCISKAGISMTTQLFAARLAEFEIPVFEVRPGIIMTDMTAKVVDKYQKLISEGVTPIRRFGQPKDVADCVVAACSGKLNFATGQVLNADGGFSIRRL